ncbi:MAG: hypothetical protein MJ160_00815 [Treponema sp.]|nr:hypothetical protein [Treponema sp.]
MKKHLILATLMTILFLVPAQKANAYYVHFKEEYYNLYHIHFKQYPNSVMENIYWLEQAAKADFCNPQFLDFTVENEKQWEKYRYLFQMHINLKLIEQHLRLGKIYDKQNIYFYDAAFKKEYLENLQITLSCYKSALYYWQEAKLWYEKADAPSFNFLFITAKQNWEDERERIRTGELDYEKMLKREIARVEKNIEQLNQMEEIY